jgi:putative MFS transporter
MAVTSTQATIAARMERVPLFSLHRKLVFVLGTGTFFDVFDIALGVNLAIKWADSEEIGELNG